MDLTVSNIYRRITNLLHGTHLSEVTLGLQNFDLVWEDVFLGHYIPVTRTHEVMKEKVRLAVACAHPVREQLLPSPHSPGAQLS